jgi:hypothetical protein
MQFRFTYRLFAFVGLVLSLLAFQQVQGQYNNTLYGFERIPQSNYLSPFTVPEADLVVGIPFLSSFSATLYSSSFSFNDIFKQDGDSLNLNLGSVADQGNNTNYLSGVFDIDLIYVGVRLKKGFLNAGVRNRVLAQSFYATDLIKLLWYGNNAYVGQQLDMEQTWVTTNHFNSWYAGYAFTVADKVDIGARLNINQGMSSIQTERHQITLQTNENEATVYDVYARTDYLVNTSGLTGDGSASDYFFNMSNIGLSLDAGVKWEIDESFAVNLSILDLGFISWSSGLKNYQSKYDSIFFAGIYADVNDENLDISQAFSDTLQELFDVIETEQSYTAGLPTRIIIGGEYAFSEGKNRVSLMLSGRLIEDYFDFSATAGFDMKVSQHFAFKATYTYLRYNPFNLGIGLVADARPFQFYLLTDNVINLFNPYNARYFNVHFGINLAWPKFKNMDTPEEQ